jgi:hypothetical protein
MEDFEEKMLKVEFEMYYVMTGKYTTITRTRKHVVFDFSVFCHVYQQISSHTGRLCEGRSARWNTLPGA